MVKLQWTDNLIHQQYMIEDIQRSYWKLLLFHLTEE